MVTESRAAVDLYWLPLGAGGHFVRMNGRIYEALAAWRGKRPRRDLYHSALIVTVPAGRFVIEQTWPIPSGDRALRGVVAEGPVGAQRARSLRFLRYEIRRWRDGVIADLDEAVESPQRLTDDVIVAERLLELVPAVPTPVWGRDGVRAGEMWNSNSLISWLSARAGLDVDTVHPPAGGRAPGWDAGITVARRQDTTSPDFRPATVSATLDTSERERMSGGAITTPPLASAPSAVDGARAFAVMLGGSIVLDIGAAASVIGVAKALVRRRRPEALAVAGVVAMAAYIATIRPWMLDWGASAEDARKPLPGDELTPEDLIESTNGVTIDAPAEEVWPWLAQLGQDRGGFYSYEWLENLAGCRMHNADRIRPEWQGPRQVGETVRLHWGFGLPVSIYTPGRALGLKGWGTFVLEPIDEQHTRLLARGHPKHGLAGLYDATLMQIPHFLMQRRMLLGIKQRAESALSESRTVR